jgi:hypothetical protein
VSVTTFEFNSFFKRIEKRDIDVRECQCQRKFSVMNVSEIFTMSWTCLKYLQCHECIWNIYNVLNVPEIFTISWICLKYLQCHECAWNIYNVMNVSEIFTMSWMCLKYLQCQECTWNSGRNENFRNKTFIVVHLISKKGY